MKLRKAKKLFKFSKVTAWWVDGDTFTPVVLPQGVYKTSKK